MPRPTPAATSVPNRPIQEFRHRNIKAAIWRNQTARGAMYDVLITRSYRDGDAWRDSHSFRYDDLMIVAKLLADAHSAITTLRAKDHAASAPPPPKRRASSDA